MIITTAKKIIITTPKKMRKKYIYRKDIFQKNLIFRK